MKAQFRISQRAPQYQFCRGEAKVVSAFMEKATIEEILNHLGFPTEPPAIHPTRPPPQASIEDFDQSRDVDFMDN